MKKTSRIVCAVLSFLLMINMCTVVWASNEDIKVIIDGQQIMFDVQPQIIDGRTLVPMRKIFESLGAVVSWDAESKTATGKMGDVVVNVTIDSNVLFKNGTPKTLDVAPALIDGRTLVPVRAIAESFACTVEWIAETRTVKITKSEGQTIQKTILTASEISERVSPSVFYIEVYDGNNEVLGSGSGFFISADGVAVTNYHVIEETASAKITTINGDIFDVTDIIAYDSELDVAIIKINKTSTKGKTVAGFSSVTMANSDKIKAGQTVYALGSPVGLQNTISNGIISNVNQTIGDESFIQITAAISHGSSGGALVDEYGEVLGITSAGIDEAQNIGFAIPINTIKMFDIGSDGVSYKEFAAADEEFVIVVGEEIVELEVGETKTVYVYANGNGDDWSIYWHTENKDLVSCKWGDWLEDYSGTNPMLNNICPLTIEGLREGTATVTVYSDVDFKGQDITVYVKNPAVEMYPNSVIPTYTAITGVRMTDYNQFEENNVYRYPFYDIETPQKYVDYLLANGFEFYDKDEKEDEAGYYYIAPNGDMMLIVLTVKWNEVWIYVKRY